jgi:polysaccharide chain length determinant protein (PEP-CTERM system associated)
MLMNTGKQREGPNTGYYFSVISRRRWFVIAPFCLAVLAGMILAMKLPKLYEASTLIFVQPQRVPEKIVTPVVDRDVENRINTLSQQIMSRSNLERVIEKFNLFADPKSSGMLVEDKLAILRKRIKVEVGRTRSSKYTDSFSIIYQDYDPQTTMKVANGLATFFIDENIKVREGMAVGTSDFLDSELEVMRKRLEDQEQVLKKFREKNMGELPEQLDSNLKILERLNQQLAQKEESLRSARVSLAALESEMTIRQGALAAAPPPLAPSLTGRESEDQMSLEQLKDKLTGLQSSYTEQHPDVVRLKAKIRKLEKQPAGARRGSDSATADAASSARLYSSAQLNAEAARQRTVISGSINTLERDISRLNQEIRDYQRRIEAAPKLEQELLTIKRDYDNIRASYNSLLNRKLEADIGVNMERKQKGEQFQIIDAAQLPEKPVSPDYRKLFLITVLAGLGVGAGLVFILEINDTSVRRLDRLEEEIGLPVLATVPRIFGAGDRMRHRMKAMATVASLAVAFILTATFAVMVFKGV